MADESMLIESSLDEPHGNDEQMTFGGEEPTAEYQNATTPSASGVSEVDGKDVATNFEKRFKDTQTALNEQRAVNDKMQAQLEVLLKQSASQQAAPQKTQEEISEEHEALIEKAREDPSILLDHFYDLLGSRDAYMEEQIRGLNGNLTRMSPEFIENQETVKSLRENPAFSRLSDEQLLPIAKQITAAKSQAKPVMKPQGSLSGDRSTGSLSKPISPEERYKSFMVAAGVAKPGSAKKGILTLEDG